MPARFDVVETDHRHVVGHPPAGPVEGAQCPEGHVVVRREHAVEVRA
jgi:hypothetical protein